MLLSDMISKRVKRIYSSFFADRDIRIIVPSKLKFLQIEIALWSRSWNYACYLKAKACLSQPLITFSAVLFNSEKFHCVQELMFDSRSLIVRMKSDCEFKKRLPRNWDASFFQDWDAFRDLAFLVRHVSLISSLYEKNL